VIVNLTPHQIQVVGFPPIPPSGRVARVAAELTDAGSVGGIPCQRREFGAVVDLPEPQADTFFVVSALVAAAAGGRGDLLAPGELVRDEAGAVIGCRCLIRS